MHLTRIVSALLSCFLPTYGTNLDQGEAAHVPQGTVIFRGADGRTLTLKDLQHAEGTVQYEIIGAEDIPEKAQSLHEQGREAGAHGDYKQAISLLEQAAALAPHWPYPVYDLAFTHLLMRDDAGARTYYEKTVAMSPRGFFTAITAADTLKRERGDLPAGTYLAYVSLESLDRTEWTAAVKQFVKRIPQFAPAWKEYAGLLEDPTERLKAIEKGLAAHPDAETRGMLQINKALALNSLGKHEAAANLLGELAVDPQSTFGTEHSAKAALAILLQK